MLAIVIPYYKLTFFEATLQSLALQTNQCFKVYVGDDASPEDPSILIDQYKSQLNMMYHRFDENYGGVALSKQWERCIALTHEEPWIMILGDDDYLTPNVVQDFFEHLGIISKEKIKVVRFATKVVNAKGESNNMIYTHPVIELSTNAYYRHYNCETRSSLSEYIFSRESFDEFKFKNFPLAWHADDLAWLEFSNCGSIYTVNHSTVIIRLSHLNISGRTDNQFLKQKARFLFFKTIVLNSKFKFLKKHKIQFLFEFGILIKEQNAVTLKNVFQVFFQFLQIGEFYNGMRFLRRMIRAKQNK
ncbi:glycosyltransferase family 2 protein [Flavobacterium sp. SOK18b]|uniref:glycosyltransferase family A protein n=1 Tax=Flavobacterium sp. SOK18b TaxID=797900 RepID=UPI0015FD5AC9|nr:glycosyltransferase family A protein [Flavobacterium sp. SOK18b]MBB1192500.1 glycosyltransferase family 2 protein [Flavobacterium sp. SOK18b]